MVDTEVPSLASAAQYFFKIGAVGKRFRPTVLLLIASALNVSKPISAINDVPSRLSKELRGRQQCIAEIAEMIHVASLLHDDVLDDADKRRGVGSLNFVVGNKLAVLSGNFLLSRACITLASLNNTEALDYLGKSRGIERAKELAAEHAKRAVEAIGALPLSDVQEVLISRRALVDLTQRVITRTE